MCSCHEGTAAAGGTGHQICRCLLIHCLQKIRATAVHRNGRLLSAVGHAYLSGPRGSIHGSQPTSEQLLPHWSESLHSCESAAARSDSHGRVAAGRFLAGTGRKEMVRDRVPSEKSCHSCPAERIPQSLPAAHCAAATTRPAAGARNPATPACATPPTQPPTWRTALAPVDAKICNQHIRSPSLAVFRVAPDYCRHGVDDMQFLARFMKQDSVV